ncbi:hemerythrin [Burkholderia sp. WAC0059]|uniref:hemerythrin domain-containing protein n=1 Tax=Burkholderia sp. WAC0059 TaxID=2066022 RepID=UPI000C7E9034|nr:hemerythrin domain-containing protein [Burkholderia sp. WAC0059]PLZ02699.1 hemerythrin [Burkholderia sp. WAC0059]
MTETIFDALRQSHAIQRTLIRQLMLSRPDERRDQLFTTLRVELGAHEAAEERYLYVPILMDDRGLFPARDALADHHKMDEIVADLRGRDRSARGWMSTLKKLSGELHEHLKEEEKIFFQISGKILSDASKAKLARQYRREYGKMRGTLLNE